MANQSELRLLNLSAGNYNLQIEAIDSLNKRIGNPILLTVLVDEFFYKTLGFYFLVGLCFFAIGTWYFLEQRKKYKLKEKFASQIINSQNEERSRVAKELHDSIGQRLLVLKNTVSLKKTTDKAELKMINDTIDEVRNISHNLHPFQFEKLGLKASLENLLDEFQKSSEVFYSHDIDAIAGILSKEKEFFVFRMLQECIVNVEKHAKATACNLTVIKKENNKSGIGLKNLHERASYLGAFFSIVSNDKGTVTTIKIRK